MNGDKAVVVIDGGYFDNLNYYLRDERNKKLSIQKLSQKVCGGLDHIRTRFYHANPYQKNQSNNAEKKKYIKNQSFLNAINKIPNHEFVGVGRVKLIHGHCPICNKDFTTPKQKGVDVAIALDLVKMARKRVADVFILISGDEDLTSAVEMSQEELCNVNVYYSNDQQYKIFGSKKLIYAAADRKIMDLDFLEACAMD
ncbi:MAG: NYN domain-containing protein [Candidatus Omnitrophica bacterium]|nr:NYN domain-containing protein [Candidatus Omnitrophota bacterium]